MAEAGRAWRPTRARWWKPPPTAPIVFDVEHWADYGRIFSLWSIPIDLVRQRSCLERLLRSPHGPPLFWLYMLLKEPRSRLAFSESAVSASSGTPLRAVCQNAVGAALKAWSDIPDVTCLQHATGSSVCSASYDGTIIWWYLMAYNGTPTYPRKEYSKSCFSLAVCSPHGCSFRAHWLGSEALPHASPSCTWSVSSAQWCAFTGSEPCSAGCMDFLWAIDGRVVQHLARWPHRCVEDRDGLETSAHVWCVHRWYVLAHFFFSLRLQKL